MVVLAVVLMVDLAVVSNELLIFSDYFSLQYFEIVTSF
jgi:hypothetical protein